jgi:predicted esterase
MAQRTIETSTHGRFLHIDRGAGPTLVGFHGYGETAEIHLAELEQIPGIERWSLVAVQALHPFYTRSGAIVASWMTALDRELAVADNLAYVGRVLDLLPAPSPLVFAGFSQGASMAARAAARLASPAALIILGGDIPPDVKDDTSVRLPAILVGRGDTDDWYTAEKLKHDLSYLQGTTTVTPVEFAGGHEWTDAFREAAGTFLANIAGTRP